MTNELFEKYTSHTLFYKGLRKGWCWLCVRCELETEQTATYWPQVPLAIATILPHSAGLLNRGSEAQALCLVLALTAVSCPQLRLVLELWLQLDLNSACLELQLHQTVCDTCFMWASHVHRIQPVYRSRYNLPTPPLGQDMTQGQFLSGV